MAPTIPNREPSFHNQHGTQATSADGEAPGENGGEEAAAARKRVVDVTKLGALERHVFIERLITKIEEDNLRLLTKFKERIDRMTLLLGPPGCGKTTLLKALSGKLDQSLKVTGEITYNGYKFNEFIPQKTSAYISQYDQHISEMTVRETLDFSARCQGIGDRADIMEEICRKEKQAGIIPEPDIDTYIKVVSEKDQEQYWQHHEVPYTFVSVDKFVNLFHKFHVGQKLTEEPSIPPTKAETDKKALSFDVYPSRWELFKACMDREWLLMKRNSFVHVSKSSQSIPRVPNIKQNYNPATWMLDITSPSSQALLGLDFASLYQESHLFKENEELVNKLRTPPEGSEELQFSTRFPQNGWQQFKACLWKQSLSYWRSPSYNLARFAFVTVCSLIFGALLWRKGKKIENEQDILDILRSVFIFMQFTGIGNCSSVLPFVAAERIVVYRERFAGMYSSWAYSLAQVIIEIPYIFLQAALFLAFTYPAIDLYWSVSKVFWYFYSMFCLLLCYNYMGLLLVSLTPSFQLASIFASIFYNITNLFSGYVIPGP
ncbi:hypothetical protein Tsubulata_041604, partial [Turnera subulata]